MGYDGVEYKMQMSIMGHTVAKLVEAPRYKPEGRRFESQMRWIFSIYLIFPAVL
jgi:hypothetical protein